MPIVSIITTTYNHKDYIAKTIESIINQDFTDWELLIGDDSPNDETRNILQTYVKRYPAKIKARHNSPSKHIVGNTNFLIDQASPDSKYLAFLEGDDMRYPEYLSEKIKIFKKYPDVGLVYNELSIIDETGKIREKRRIAPRTKKWYKNETETIWKLIANDLVCFSYSTLMSKKFKWLKIHNRWNDTLLWSESDFWLQIAKKHNIYGIEKPLTLYRKHGSNTSKDLNITIENFEFFIQQYVAEGEIKQEEYKKIQILIAMMKSFNNIKNKEYKKIFDNVIVCFKLSRKDTIYMWIDSLYYRFIKPFIFKLIHTSWKK
jgi:glycosyltransferase involved in cell wall biosynthesis